MKTNGDERAFSPATGIGLTKREYFAALAMQGYCAHPLVDVRITASWAVQQADALIAELNKERAK